MIYKKTTLYQGSHDSNTLIEQIKPHFPPNELKQNPFICSNISEAPAYLSVDTIFQSWWFLSGLP
jgi:hypothetical protein